LRSILRDEFGRYSAVEVAVASSARDPDEGQQPRDVLRSRTRSSRTALPLSKTALGEYHVEPERILIRAVRFPAGYEERLQDARSTNEVKIARILAEADIYERSTRADTDASYVEAVAQGEALDTVGGRLLLALRAAENLQFDSVTLNSNDPDALVELLVGE